MAMEWEKLPIDVLRMVVKNMTENTRNALRACSIGNKEVVEMTRFNSIYLLEIRWGIERNEENWEIHIKKDQFGTPFNITCATFESLQNELICVLESVDYVKVLRIVTRPGKQLKLMKDGSGRRVRVEEVLLPYDEGFVGENVLSQIEPVYLRKVFMLADGGNSRIYDMPQIVHAEELRVLWGCSINEAQLLKLKARYIDLHQPSCSLRNYFKKCSLNVGRVMPRFKFHYVDSSLDIGNINFVSSLPKKEFLLDTDVPEIKLKLTLKKLKNTSPLCFNVEGTLFYEPRRAAPHISHFHQTALRRIEKIHVRCAGQDDSKWTICVAYKFQSLKLLTGISVGEVQKVLDDVFENTDHVRDFHIGLSPAMTWKPRKTKLIVNELIVCSKSLENVHSFLQQIDPIYLDSLKIITQEKIGESVDMRYNDLYEIDYLDNFYMRSDKNSRPLVFPLRLITRGLRDKFATENFINRYLKHVMRRLNKKTCYFDFYEEKEGENEEDEQLNLQKISEEVDFSGNKRDDSNSKLYIYKDSPYPDHVSLLIKGGDQI